MTEKQKEEIRVKKNPTKRDISILFKWAKTNWTDITHEKSCWCSSSERNRYRDWFFEELNKRS